MADLIITAASVLKQSGASTNSSQVAGEALTAGQPVFQNTSDNKLYKAKNNTAANALVYGIVLNTSVSTGQPVFVLTAGLITIGATVVVGTAYIVSATFGGICPDADKASGNFVTEIGRAINATTISVSFIITGIAVP